MTYEPKKTCPACNVLEDPPKQGPAFIYILGAVGAETFEFADILCDTHRQLFNSLRNFRCDVAPSLVLLEIRRFLDRTGPK
jgi:hypothetical protein